MKNLTNPLLIDIQGKNPHTNQDVTSISWNDSFDSIAATCSSEGLCVIWELKLSKSILQFSNNQRRSYSAVAWNPEGGFEVAVASQTDESPVIEIWDMRKAYAPLRELKGHTAGILSLSWCIHDSNLLLSAGKDGKGYIWNPIIGEQLGELPSSDEWMYDVKWSYRPSILSTASFDSSINIYSLQDSSSAPHTIEQNESDSTTEQNSFLGAISQNKKRPASQPVSANVFKTAPKWLKRPIGGTFGFGGRFVTFNNKKVNIGTLRGDELSFQKEMDSVFESRNFISFCQKKMDENLQENYQQEAETWMFMKTLFAQNRDKELLSLLGYNKDDIQAEIDTSLPVVDDSGVINENPYSPIDQVQIDSLLQKCVITSNWKGAVDLCFKAERYADALLLAASGGNELWLNTRDEYIKKQSRPSSVFLGKMISNVKDLAEDGDLSEWKKILAALCAFGKRDFSDLVTLLGDRLAESGDDKSASLCYMISGLFSKTIDIWFKTYDEEYKHDPHKKGLTQLMQKTMVFQQAYPNEDVLSHPRLAEIYTDYANLLASQGELQKALQYLNAIAGSSGPDSQLNQLRFRVYHSMLKPTGDAPPPPTWAASQAQESRRIQQPQPQQQRAVDQHWNQNQFGQYQPNQTISTHNQQYPTYQQLGQPQIGQQHYQQLGQPHIGHPVIPNLQPTQHIQGLQSVHSAQQPYQPIHQNVQQSLHPVQPVQPLQPLQPIQPIQGNQSVTTSKPVYTPTLTSSINQSPISSTSTSSKIGEPEANFGIFSSGRKIDDKSDVVVELNENQKNILSFLSESYHQLSNSNLDGPNALKLSIIEKDLTRLKEQFTHGKVESNIEKELENLIAQLKNHDSKGAQVTVTNLAAFGTHVRTWIKGVKFLVQLLKDYSN